jgi:hypothetical protein
MPEGSPVVGDFNGDGIDEIGVFRDGHWYLDIDGDGAWDISETWITFSMETFVPVVGKW